MWIIKVYEFPKENKFAGVINLKQSAGITFFS